MATVGTSPHGGFSPDSLTAPSAADPTMDESSSDLSDDFRCTAPLDNLRRRAAMLKQLRGFFDARDFIEVETPLLSADTVVDHHLDPIPVLLPDDPCYLDQGQPLFLQTSPEFAMKRLLASGLGSIYQITHAFRLGERGTRHNPEFTMVEWYRVGDDLQAGINLLGTLACELFAAPRWSAISYQDAFLRETQIDPMQVTSRELLETLRARDVPIPSDSEQDRELLLDAVLTELVEPRLGRNQPEIIFDYPAQQSALARVVQRDEVSVAERFELYYRGIELANGYHELLDAEELLARNRTNNRLRQRDGKALLPEQSRLLAAMQEGLPPCAGTALGFDRLMMLLTGATTIDEVIAFPIDRA